MSFSNLFGVYKASYIIDVSGYAAACLRWLRILSLQRRYSLNCLRDPEREALGVQRCILFGTRKLLAPLVCARRSIFNCVTSSDASCLSAVEQIGLFF